MAIKTLIEIALNLWITLGSIDILTVMNLWVHEQGIVFPFIVSSFSNVLQFSVEVFHLVEYIDS